MIYADVLIIINTAVDYLLLCVAEKAVNGNLKIWRKFLSSAAGGVFSLAVFLPQMPSIISFLFKIIMCIILCFIAFGFKNIHSFIRANAAFLAANFAFSGFMYIVWHYSKIGGIYIKNSVVYLNISPLFLVLSALGFYIISVIVYVFFGKKTPQAKECGIKLFYGGREISLNGIVDTGNSVRDVFGADEVIIVSETVAQKITNGINDETRFRVLPCMTVAGSCLLKGVRIDAARITFEGKTHTYKNIIIAVSKTDIPENSAIVNPGIFL